KFYLLIPTTLNATLDMQLYVTDGTAANTILLKDLGSVYMGYTAALGSNFAFTATAYGSTGTGTALYGSNGTLAGTGILKAFGNNPSIYAWNSLGTHVSLFALTYSGGTYDTALYGTDGTIAGTAVLRDFSNTISIINYTAAISKLFF